jgi:hypothetical protein
MAKASLMAVDVTFEALIQAQSDMPARRRAALLKVPPQLLDGTRV